MATAWTRLWRRAPAWRFCLFGAIAMTGLAAMFPPAAPDWFTAWRLGGRASSGAADGAARFAAQPDTQSFEGIEYLPPGSMRSGVIPFAGRQLPLPYGAWQELAFGLGPGAVQANVTMLARLEDDRVSGLLIASAPSVPGSMSGPLGLPSLCVAANTISHHITPASASDAPSSHECWTLSATDLTQGAWQAGQNSLQRHSLDRLALLHASVPDHMLTLTFFRSNESGVLEILFLVPDDRASSPGQVALLREWADRYAARVNKGFLGTAMPGETPREPR